MTDDGGKAVRIEIDERKYPDTGSVKGRTAKLAPPGFRSPCISVYLLERLDPKTLSIYYVVEVAWDPGSPDGSLSNEAMTRAFIVGLEKALEIQAEWTREFSARQT